jgi:methylmalonyl-CoA epimerase
MKKIDHIGIAVKNLEKSISFYRDVLGLDFIRVEEVPEEKVKIAIFRVGEAYIELVQGTSPDSVITKFVEKRGEGIHHIALRVDDVGKLSKELREKGIKIIYNEPKLVAKGGRKINFIHPKSTGGVLLEILERYEDHE